MIIENKTLILLAMVSLLLFSPVIVSAAQPFNVAVELPDNYKMVNPGNEVWFTIKLLNLANSQRVDVTLNYDILDSEGKSIVHNSKTVAIETQASFVGDLTIPKNTPSGDYILSVIVSSSLGESTAKTSLNVSTPKNNLIIYYILGGIVLLMLLLFALIKSKPIIENIKLKMKIGKIVRDKLKNK